MLLTQPDAPLSAARESNVTAAVSADGEGAFTSRLLQSAIHALALYSIYFGEGLGVYAALQFGHSNTTSSHTRCRSVANLHGNGTPEARSREVWQVRNHALHALSAVQNPRCDSRLPLVVRSAWPNKRRRP